jgi:hypothetical protein
LARRFVWYPPERLIDILIDQNTVVDPSGPMATLGLMARGDATLVCSSGGRNWLIEILEDGLPAYFTVLDGTMGNRMSEGQAKAIASASD